MIKKQNSILINIIEVEPQICDFAKMTSITSSLDIWYNK